MNVMERKRVRRRRGGDCIVNSDLKLRTETSTWRNLSSLQVKFYGTRDRLFSLSGTITIGARAQALTLVHVAYVIVLFCFIFL
jgi:hypothetical protein